MLLQNIDSIYDLCNRTQLLCLGLYKNMLDVEIITGSNAGKRAFLPIIKLKTNASSGLPFVLSRKQLTVRLSFAITINKPQGRPFSMSKSIFHNMFSVMVNYMQLYHEEFLKIQQKFSLKKGKQKEKMKTLRKYSF